MRYEFEIAHTKHGCTVHCTSPNGRRQRKTFRNTYQAAALTKAAEYIAQERDSILSFAAEIGKPAPEILIPDGILSDRRTRRVTLPVEIWAALEGKNLSAILSDALGLTGQPDDT